MRGQWLGGYRGSTDGKIMINIDEVDDHFEGVAYLNPSTQDSRFSCISINSQQGS
jgi:hypothetical protein